MAQSLEPDASTDEQAVPAPNYGRAQAPEGGIDFASVAAQAGEPNADPCAPKAKVQRLNAKVNRSPRVSAFSLQHLAFPHSSRRQRADCVKKKQPGFFNYLGPEAREILDLLLEKYATDGELRLVAVRKHLPDVLKVPPISQRGNVNEIIGKFGGADQFSNTVNLSNN
jgi:type I restriction enzyme R subunit